MKASYKQTYSYLLQSFANNKAWILTLFQKLSVKSFWWKVPNNRPLQYTPAYMELQVKRSEKGQTIFNVCTKLAVYMLSKEELRKQ